MPTATGSLAFLGAARFQGTWNAANNRANGSGLSGAPSGAIVGLFLTGTSTTNGGYAHAHNTITASAGDYWQVTGSGTHNVDGDSASITMATAIISAFEGVPIEQNLAMPGSLSVRGEVLPIGGVTAKIEAAAKAGIETIIIPRSNLQDVLIDEKYESMVTIRPVDSLDEVLQYALVGADEKVSLVERLANVIDTFSSQHDKQPSA